jgi:RimJ/RimL family protein N-acetyltransferase
MRLEEIEIRTPRKSDPVKAYLDFISELIDEDPYILINKKPTMKEQKKWFAERLRKIRNGELVSLTAWDGKKLVANSEASRDRGKDRDNVGMGLAVSKGYRGWGLGEKVLRALITLAKRKLKPHNIYLTVYSENKIARRLYGKVGFRMLARFPNWTLHRGKYRDHLYLILKK